jgi:hypothetical protein
MDKIEQAKKTLRDAGYFTDLLWHVDDVKSRYKCDDETAHEILNDALFDNEATMEQIWFAIDFHIDEHKERN